MSDTTTAIEVLLQRMLATIPYSPPSPNHLEQLSAAASVYAQFVAMFAAFPTEPRCKAYAIDALGDAFLWTLRGLVEPQTLDAEESHQKQEDNRNLASEYIRLKEYFEQKLPYNPEKSLAIEAAKHAYQLALDSFVAQEKDVLGHRMTDLTPGVEEQR